MRRSRPVREHDPEWRLVSRIYAALWKMVAVVFVAIVFQLSFVSRAAMIFSGLLLLAFVGIVIAQSRRRPPP